jgi:hypothetical protein
MKHAGASLTSPPGAATSSEEIFGVPAETEETSCRAPGFLGSGTKIVNW